MKELCKFDEEVAQEALARMAIAMELPLCFVAHEKPFHHVHILQLKALIPSLAIAVKVDQWIQASMTILDHADKVHHLG